MYYQVSTSNGISTSNSLIWDTATNQWLTSSALTLLEQRVAALESV
jgi:hypothetical protein